MSNALDSLKGVKQWVCWSEWVDPNRNKRRKVPMNPFTGRAASSTDPKTWGTYEDAKRCFLSNTNKFKGLGFVFTKESGIVGIDLDDCLDENGEIKHDVRWIVETLDSYTELSPSEKGLHILLHGRIPGCIKREKEGVEIYNEKRYFTITGKMIDDFPDRIERRQREIMTIYNQYQKEYDNQITSARIADMLSCIPPEGLDYDTEWLKVLMAVHSELPNDEGLQLVKNWCEHTSMRGELESKWRSFDSDGGRGIGSLVYIAQQHGYKFENDSLLDTVHPPLTYAQKTQVKAIIKQIQYESFYLNLSDEDKRTLSTGHSIPIPFIDHLKIGRIARVVDIETGEITRHETVTVPYYNLAGDVVNLEYVTDYGSYMEFDVDDPFYFLPLWERESHEHVILLPDCDSTMLAVLNHGQMTIQDRPVGFFGLPAIETSLSMNFIEKLGANNITLVVDKTVNSSLLKPLKGHCRVINLPDVSLIEHVETKDLVRMMSYARQFNGL